MQQEIHIQNLPVNCIIGCWDYERSQEQKICADITITLNSNKLVYQNVSETWDYSSLAKDVEFILQAGQFFLLENASAVLCQYFLSHDEYTTANRPQIQKAKIGLSKFHVLPGEAVANVSMTLDKSEVCLPKQEFEWGSITQISQTEKLKLKRVHVLPNKQTDIFKSQMTSHVYSLSNELKFKNNKKESLLSMHQMLEISPQNKIQVVSQSSKHQFFLIVEHLQSADVIVMKSKTA